MNATDLRSIYLLNSSFNAKTKWGHIVVYSTPAQGVSITPREVEWSNLPLEDGITVWAR